MLPGKLMLSETTQIQANPDRIDFGIGQPQLELLPRQLLLQASQTVLSQADNSLLNYGHPKGDGRFRLALSEFLAPRYGVEVDPGSFVTTNGASQALDLIASIFTCPGDTVLVEEPTYFLSHRIFTDRGLKVVGVPLAEDGLDLERLEQAVTEHRPKLVYTIPVFQNPTGISLSRAKKQALVEMAQAQDFLIVADEVYQLLSYGATPPPPLAGWLDSQKVLSVGSFSKILAPGLRLGWIQSGKKLQQRLLECGLLRSGGGLNPLIGGVVGEVLRNGSQADYTDFLRRTYSHRVDLLDRALRDLFGSRVRFCRPEGGYFFWLELVDGRDAEQLSQQAAEAGTGFRAGVRFSSQRGLRSFLRLSFAHYGDQQLLEGVERLTSVLG